MDTNIPPTTTAAEDLVKAGQREVNLIWERKQASIASWVVGTALVVSSAVALLIIYPNATEKQTAMAITAFVLISNLVSLVIGFYFGRTNHTKVGGVGSKDEQTR